MKIIKYFFQFSIILILFFLFRILGYKNASNLGSKIGKIFGKLIRSDKIILKNISYINKYSKTKIDSTDQIVDDVFSNYGRILSDYVYLNKFRSGSLKKWLHRTLLFATGRPIQMIQIIWKNISSTSCPSFDSLEKV